MSVAVLGGGCFWCVEALLQRLKGVIKVVPGYCGGNIPNPTYEQVKKGTTGHIEVVQITFDPQQIDFETLLNVFMNVHDPTQPDGQGEDIGTQYISAIFCQDEQQKQIAEKVVNQLNAQAEKNGKKIYTVIRNQSPFYEAQDYHHNYWNERGSQNPYCSIIPPKIAKMKKLFKDIVREE